MMVHECEASRIHITGAMVEGPQLTDARWGMSMSSSSREAPLNSFPQWIFKQGALTGGSDIRHGWPRSSAHKGALKRTQA